MPSHLCAWLLHCEVICHAHSLGSGGCLQISSAEQLAGSWHPVRPQQVLFTHLFFNQFSALSCVGPENAEKGSDPMPGYCFWSFVLTFGTIVPACPYSEPTWMTFCPPPLQSPLLGEFPTPLGICTPQVKYAGEGEGTAELTSSKLPAVVWIHLLSSVSIPVPPPPITGSSHMGFFCPLHIPRSCANLPLQFLHPGRLLLTPPARPPHLHVHMSQCANTHITHHTRTHTLVCLAFSHHSNLSS